jgi:hypothetical protein
MYVYIYIYICIYIGWYLLKTLLRLYYSIKALLRQLLDGIVAVGQVAHVPTYIYL